MSPPASVLDLLTLLRLPGIGARGAVQLAERDLAQVRASEEWKRATQEAEAVLADCRELEIGVVGWFDETFPSRLREIPQAPAVIFFRGALGVAESARSAAIVGTREPTVSGIAATVRIADAFAVDGWAVVSGLALGVDTIAHRRALDAGAPTVAVLGNGLATVYPTVNRELADEIVTAGGLLVAEVPPRAKVDPRALVKRDRLQSGLASLTVVCQGGIRSGAMHTARYAIEQGRPLYCAAFSRPGDALDPQDEGIAALLGEPGERLPELLPAWKRAPLRKLGNEPVARPISEVALRDLGNLEPCSSASGTLF